MIPKKLSNIISKLNSFDWVKSIIKDFNIYLVGGCVRDAFLNKSIKDIDLIVEGISLSDLKEKLNTFGRVDIVGESFSVIKFKPFNDKDIYDIAIPRVDRKINSGHKGFEVITKNVSIIDDLKRRDFTINSIAINVKTLEILDPFNGLNDLKIKQIKATDENAFIEDALRILRGIQFASRFDFKIKSKTFELMKQHSSLIKEISGERILEELNKIVLKNGNCCVAFDLIKETISNSLFNNEMKKYNGPEHLDIISFFHLFCSLGGVDDLFLKNNLKSDSNLHKDVKTLSIILSEINSIKSYSEFKLFLFECFEKSPGVKNCVILPLSIINIVSEMKRKLIPSKSSDVKITGDDIILMTKLKPGPKIKIIKDKMIMDALMMKYNWKSRKSTLKYFKENIL